MGAINTIFISLFVTFLSLFLGALAAYALARFNFMGQRVVLMFLIITQMFPLILLCIPYFRVFVMLGLYDTRTSLIIVYLTFTLPFCILMLRSYFMNISPAMAISRSFISEGSQPACPASDSDMLVSVRSFRRSLSMASMVCSLRRRTWLCSRCGWRRCRP